MTAKFKQIIDQLNALITFKVDKSMCDEEFIANIDAINLLCYLHDDLGLDRSGIRRRMSNLYPEFTRRINGNRYIQLAVPLIKAFLHEQHLNVVAAEIYSRIDKILDKCDDLVSIKVG